MVLEYSVDFVLAPINTKLTDGVRSKVSCEFRVFPKSVDTNKNKNIVVPNEYIIKMDC